MARDIEREVREAFDGIRADDALKERTREAVLAQMRAAREGTIVAFSDSAHAQRLKPKRKGLLAAVAACLAIACLLFVGGYQLYFTPVAAISVDVNPSVELGVNRFDRVVDVDAYNADGQALADELGLEHEGYAQAVQRIVESAKVQELLAADEDLDVSVACADSERCDAMLAVLEQCTAAYSNASCHHVDDAEVEQAHHAGLSFGKYCAYLAARDADKSLTVEQARDMTMRELHDCADGHEGSAADEHVSEHGAGQGSSSASSGSSSGGEFPEHGGSHHRGHHQDDD